MRRRSLRILLYDLNFSIRIFLRNLKDKLKKQKYETKYPIRMPMLRERPGSVKEIKYLLDSFDFVSEYEYSISYLIEDLGEIGGKEAVQILLELKENPDFYRYHLEIVWSIAKCKDPNTVNILLEWLTDDYIDEYEYYFQLLVLESRFA